MSNNPAIVTGAPGWLGSKFVDCLTKGMSELGSRFAPSDRTVFVLVDESIGEAQIAQLQKQIGPSLKVVRGDLTRRESLSPLFAGAEGATLFHLAAVIHPSKGTQQFFEVNSRGTENLLALAESSGVKRFVYMSSNSPLGVNPDKEHVFDESAPYNPYMKYGQSKMIAEKAVAKAGSAKRLETVIIRSCWFYGPGQPARQNLFFSMIKNGKVPLVGDGSNKRSMAYIDNVCQGLMLAEKVENANGQIYWIADRKPYAMSEIIDTIEEVLESEFHLQVAHKRMRLPNVASSIAYGIDGVLQSMGLYHQKMHVLSEMNKTIACSVAKAERELGYDPQIALKEGMRRSIQWVLDQGVTL